MPDLPKTQADIDGKPYYERGKSREYRNFYDWRWRKYSERRLKKHPLCINCLEGGRTKLAGVTDHIIPHKGNKQLFWNKSNHQSLCFQCHNRKTAKEGAFGK